MSDSSIPPLNLVSQSKNKLQLICFAANKLMTFDRQIFTSTRTLKVTFFPSFFKFIISKCSRLERILLTQNCFPKISILFKLMISKTIRKWWLPSLISCFALQLLVGSDYTMGWVPTKLKEETFRALLTHNTHLEEYYEYNGHCYRLKADR